MSTEIRDLIRQMSIADPLWGAPRIHGELLKLGIDVSQAKVGRYLPRRPKVPSTWRRILYALIVLGHDRRNVIHFDVSQNPTLVWFSRQMAEAFPWDTAPRYLLRDRDASYGPVFGDRVRVMGMKEVVSAPRSPWQNPYVERLIGSIRRECLDHTIIFNESHLRRVLSYFQYHHWTRTHQSLDKDCPQPRRIQSASAVDIIAFSEVGGLHHHYERCAARRAGYRMEQLDISKRLPIFLSSGDGERFEVVGTHVDVTERKRAQEEPVAHAVGLRRVEGFEEKRQALRAQPMAGIPHRDAHALRLDTH
jgi:putative transposase